MLGEVHLRIAAVLRTEQFDGHPTRKHSKFISVDHRFVLVTSANFSWSAENLPDAHALTHARTRSFTAAGFSTCKKWPAPSITSILDPAAR